MMDNEEKTLKRNEEKNERRKDKIRENADKTRKIEPEIERK